MVSNLLPLDSIERDPGSSQALKTVPQRGTLCAVGTYECRIRSDSKPWP
jgi:hypothetical protein